MAIVIWVAPFIIMVIGILLVISLVVVVIVAKVAVARASRPQVDQGRFGVRCAICFSVSDVDTDTYTDTDTYGDADTHTYTNACKHA